MSHDRGNHGALGVVTVKTTSTPFVGANGNRVALTISCPAAHQITISNRNPAVSGQGLVIPIGVAPVKLTLADVGDWLQSSLYAIAVTASETIGYVEVICPCRDPLLTR